MVTTSTTAPLAMTAVHTTLDSLGALSSSDACVQSQLGCVFGNYKTVQSIGRGGMGSVYLAVREGDFERSFALKLIQSRRRNQENIRRFHIERRVLARLQHPNIARLHDGGTTSDDLPFLVMEHIVGEPIDDYCDRRRLSIRERLVLMREVCDALAYAHRNEVVHRDLKPENILVEASGTPKLLDFGIAKLLAPEGIRITYGRQPMTLRYASPEQLSGSEITPRTDIYGLGVLLYLILAGRLPGELESLTYPELLRAIALDEPAAPSTMVMWTQEIPSRNGPRILTPEAISRDRSCDPITLRNQLDGSLDRIVLKALRKDPADRYASMEDLSEDLGRYLGGMAVSAK